jgi:hypothetical protein
LRETITSFRSVAAGLFYFLLDQKVIKNQVSRKASFAAPGLCPANRVKPGTQKFRAFAAPRYACASAKLAIHLQPHCPTSFYPVSPEAGLLPGYMIYTNLRRRFEESTDSVLSVRL